MNGWLGGSRLSALGARRMHGSCGKVSPDRAVGVEGGPLRLRFSLRLLLERIGEGIGHLGRE
jgi:hypothetical protein